MYNIAEINKLQVLKNSETSELVKITFDPIKTAAIK